MCVSEGWDATAALTFLDRPDMWGVRSGGEGESSVLSQKQINLHAELASQPGAVGRTAALSVKCNVTRKQLLFVLKEQPGLFPAPV